MFSVMTTSCISRANSRNACGEVPCPVKRLPCIDRQFFADRRILWDTSCGGRLAMTGMVQTDKLQPVPIVRAALRPRSSLMHHCSVVPPRLKHCIRLIDRVLCCRIRDCRRRAASSRTRGLTAWSSRRYVRPLPCVPVPILGRLRLLTAPVDPKQSSNDPRRWSFCEA
jgi:hypothetical protein